MDPETMDNVKCVVIGDGAVGKTCMLVSFTTNKFPPDYSPTIFDNHTAQLTVDERPITLGLWDTAGQEDFEKLRPLSYSETDVFIVCYAVNLRSSFEHVSSKWVPEIEQEDPDCPFIIVATKSDLRDEVAGTEKEKKFVSTAEGEEMKEKVNAHCFVECSALHQKNLQKVFDEACRCVFDVQDQKELVDKERRATDGKENASGAFCCGLF